MVIYPNGNKIKNAKEHVSLYLAIEAADSLPPGWEVHAVFRFFLLDQIRDNYLIIQGIPVFTLNLHTFVYYNIIEIIAAYQILSFIFPTLNDKIFFHFVNLFSLITINSQRLNTCNFKVLAICQLYFCYIVLPIDTTKKEKRFRGMKLEWGLDKAISLKAFNDASNGFLVDDTCVFGAEVFVCKERSTGKGECVSLIKDAIANKYVWKIENYSKLNEESYDSKPFNAGDQKWYL